MKTDITEDAEFRIERDSLGQVKVPKCALYAAQTQRAIQNFQLSNLVLPHAFISAVALIKQVAAVCNERLGLLCAEHSHAIQRAAVKIQEHAMREQFPVDVFQTGSGTSTNMNVNEVIATLCQREFEQAVHPNDHVNLGQSSNDVIPTAIHIAGTLAIHQQLLPNLLQTKIVIDQKAKSVGAAIKTGRTHLMDAMPIQFSQELSGWSAQIQLGIDRVNASLPRLFALAQGGTAVGTGINTHPQFADMFAEQLARMTGLPFVKSSNFYQAMSSQDAVVEMSGQLKVIAVSLMKIANDLRLMNSGPLAGFGDIELAALQPGSSIMPGKVNPVIPEAVAMVAAQVIGNDMTITIAGQSGNFQLNVMLPVIAYNFLQNIDLISSASKSLANDAIAHFSIQFERVESFLALNPMLITALSPLIGYDKAAQIAKRAYREKRCIVDVAVEETTLTQKKLSELLDPFKLTIVS